MTTLLKITVFVCASGYIVANLAADTCQTPDKQQGVCKPFKECLSLYSLLDNLTQPITTHLRQHHCGFEANHPKVCCPKSTEPDSSIHFNPDSTPSKQNTDGSTTILQHSLLPNKDSCGSTDEDRIIGNYLSLYQYPWTAILMYQANNQSKIDCAGTLISSRYVLTSAGCTTGNLPGGAKLVRVRLREHDLASNPDCDNPDQGLLCGEPFIEIPIEKTIVHEKYRSDDANHRHDIALIRLNKTVVSGDFLQPLCLPSGTDVHKNYTGVKLVQPGWGINNEKVSNSVRVRSTVKGQSSEECGKMFGFNLNRSQLCTIKSESHNKLCSLDIGGSVMSIALTEDYPNFYAAGVASAGACGGGQPALYTKVGDYSAWIVSKLEK
ncbi:hypothetical protein Zmor_019278 [Zophobas morio]|uniref:CLIP domain-containing serine protease n=1 Tax=Zophobas morio TaxID=2755281 RepID=A0AA38I5J9_9CUCU|nr:hypothetical protein Zmor_019278 [Zophobas morio]